MSDGGTQIPQPPSLIADVRPYDGGLCTKRDHVVRGGRRPRPDLLHACDCRCVLVGDDRVEIRFGLLPGRFPDA